MSETAARCVWCDKQLVSRPHGGSKQAFCNARHRHSFHTAARRWAVLAVERGILTVDDLRNGATGAYTLAVGAKGPSPAPVHQNGQEAAVDRIELDMSQGE